MSKSFLYRSYFKRLVDVIGVVVFILLFFWIPVLILIAYGITLEFPVLFRQDRIGKDDISFTLWKFRTLSPDESLAIQARVFSLGSFLRRTNLDEFPQLWNILCGDMSFIGPRPLPNEYLPLFSEEQRKRHRVLPGITGWAQINGGNSISWKEKFELDLYYARNLSLRLDTLIFIKTVALFFTFRKDSSLTEKKFNGDN